MKFPKKSGRWIIFALFIGILVFFLSGSDGFVNLYKLHLQDRKMEEEILGLNLKKDSLKIIIEKLRNDTLYLEKIAREKLGMAREDEKVFRFIGDK
ncbi:MAG: septum formation initiator family protein [Chitinispirillia bacterium]|jgi:cell division protein FtsB